MKKIILFCIAAGLSFASLSFAQKQEAHLPGSRTGNPAEVVQLTAGDWKSLPEPVKRKLNRSMTDAEKQEASPALSVASEGKSRQLKLSGVRKSSSNEGVATIVLKADDVYENGVTGYQLLLDADAETYGSVFTYANGYSVRGDWPDSIYAKFEYKIPANADGATTTSNVIVSGSDTVRIPEGVYDFCIVRPVPGQYIWRVGVEWDENMNISSGTTTYGAAYQNDFLFRAGYEYMFEPSYPPGYFDDKVGFFPEYDACLSKVSLPRPSASLGSAEDITVTVANTGVTTIPASSILFNYKANGGNTVTETFPSALEPGQSTDYTFTAKADLSAIGNHAVEAWLTYEDDLLPYNDEASGSTVKTAVFQTPFTENFESADNLSKWYIEDANADGYTWKYTNSSDGEKEIMLYTYNNNNGGDDYLISSAIALTGETDYHLNFYHKVYSGYYVEDMEVLYGTSSNPAEMTLLLDLANLRHTVWRETPVNFRPSVSGNYYFAFRVKSKAYQWELMIDQIEIAEGKYELSSDLEMKYAILPTSGCGLSEESVIGAAIYNAGTDSIRNFTLTYTVNGGAEVSETFSDLTINMYEYKIVYFTQPADLSAVGNYIVNVTAQWSGDTNTENNTASAEVKHFSPAVLPFVSDFSLAEDAAKWSSAGFPALPTNREEPSKTAYWWNPDGWNGTPCYQVNQYSDMNSTPLVSRCINLLAGTYKMSWTFDAGALVWFFALPESFDVIFGKNGTDPSGWSVLKSYTNIITYEVGRTDEAVFEITEPGEYQMGFVTDTVTFYLYLYSVTLETAGYDVRVNSIDAQASPRMLPKYHAGGEQTVSVEVENIGKGVEAQIGLKMNGNSIGSLSAPIYFPLGEIKEVELPVDFGSVEKGELTIGVTLSLDEEDANPLDNSLEAIIQVSDSTFAWDAIEDNFPGGVGTGRFGTMFELKKADKLTSVNIGFYGDASLREEEFGFAVYKVTGEGIDRLTNDVYYKISPIAAVQKDFVRGIGSIPQTFVLPPTELEAGIWYFEIGATDIGVAYDTNPEGHFYVRSGSSIFKNTSFYQFISHSGYLHIRPNFNRLLETSVDNPEHAPKVSLYPNPAKDVLHISSDEEIDRIAVYDMLGTQIYISPAGLNTENYTINTGGFSSGVYIARIKTAEGEVSMRFIVQ